MTRLGLLAAPALLAMLWNCGVTADTDAPAAGLDAGGVDSAAKAPGDAAPASDGSTSEPIDGSTSPCIPDAPCATNVGAPCKQGRTSCATGTACVDGPEATDGTACSGGLCALGTCRGPTNLPGNTNLSTDPVTPGRVCAEAPAFAVSALTANAATLATAPTTDCLVAGDEVLLINLQGSSLGTANVGNWELLRVTNVTGAAVTFMAPKTRSYGAAAGSDTDIGTGATDQKVALVRVPQFGHLTIAGSGGDGGSDAGVSVTANPWNGALGGVVVLRAARLTVDGAITAAGLGYRPGAWSQDDSDCDDNVLTQSGESFTGPAAAQIANNGGAPGGISAAQNDSFNGDTPVNASAGHASAGAIGSNPNTRTLGAPGVAYGLGDAGTLTMGSGASGNLTCDVGGVSGGALIAPFQTTAGGIVLLLAGELAVGATGSISASASPGIRDVSSSGGYVHIRGTSLSVGTGRVTAVGGTVVTGTAGGVSNKSSDGYIVLTGATKSGTTIPAAN